MSYLDLNVKLATISYILWLDLSLMYDIISDIKAPLSLTAVSDIKAPLSLTALP